MTDEKGRNLLMIAVERNFIELARQLLASKFNTLARDNKNQNILFYLSKRSRNSNDEMESLILNCDLPFFDKNSKNETAFEKAQRNQKNELALRILIKYQQISSAGKCTDFSWVGILLIQNKCFI